ncbi:MAG: hypothetical protein WCP97_09600 [bacterium]
MRIRDVRQTTEFLHNNSYPERDSNSIDAITIHSVNIPDATHAITHYLVLPDGTIEYLKDISYTLSNPTSVDIGLAGDFTIHQPSLKQLQGAADIISYLLIPRHTTKNLTKADQVTFAKHDNSQKSPEWMGYLTGNKTFSQPKLQAEFTSQKIVLPRDGNITFKVIFKNTGNETWYNSGETPTKLNVCWEGNASSAKLQKEYNVPHGSSLFRHPSWLDDFCPALMKEPEVKTNEHATFLITLAGNNVKPGTYIEDFGLANSTQWIDNLVNGNAAGKAHCWLEIEVV